MNTILSDFGVKTPEFIRGMFRKIGLLFAKPNKR